MDDTEYRAALWAIADGKLFADLPEDPVARRNAIIGIYRKYARLIHPDIRPHNTEARDAFIELERQKTDALLGETEPVFIPFVLQVRKRKYEVTGLKHKGDMARIYTARVDGNHVLLKVPHSFQDNDLMEAELAAYKAVPYFKPVVFDSFALLDENKRRKKVTVFKDAFGLDGVTLEEIKAFHPHGVDPRVMAFIINRVLECLANIHEAGFRHGAVTPNHVVINHRTHGGFLVDWTNAVAPGPKLVRRDKKYEAYFPPESPHQGQSADLYGAAKCAVMIVGGYPNLNTVPESVPKLVRDFLNRCLQPKPAARYQTALLAYDEFKDILHKVYGPPKFVALEIPTK